MLDKRPFPGNLVIAVRISELGNLMWTPVQENRKGFHICGFGMLGVVFDLAVGAKIPAEFYAIGTAPNPRRYLWVVRSQDDFLFDKAADMYRDASATTRPISGL